ncbi:MAG TPA: NTP transferase domain-containing protein [Candidatus Limnocylindria bacterium]|nr:NTP transferase domain-containing protein [Candidatus Limnocylindria bacterium]
MTDTERHTTDPTPRVAVIVAAGGRSSRLAGDKLTAEVAGRTLLDHTLDGLPADAQVVCVGREVSTTRAVVWVRESPEFGGPLAAVEAGVEALPDDATVVVLVGGDMPGAGRAVPHLLAALGGDQKGGAAAAPACAVTLDGTGREQPLLSAWRRSVLVERLAELRPTAGRALTALLDSVAPVTIEDRWGAATDVDTRADLAAARERLGPA